MMLSRRLGIKKRPPRGPFFTQPKVRSRNLVVLGLTHGVVFTTGLQSRFTSEELFVVITDVGTGHVLVLHSSDALTDFLTLYTSNVGQHAFVTEVALGQVVGRQSRSVVRRQSDQVMEYTSFTGRITLEVTAPLVSQLTQLVLSYSALISLARS